MTEKVDCKKKEEEPLYIHSKCCMAHWEMMYHDRIIEILCEKCGKTSGIKIKHHIENPKCGCCECENETM